MTYYKAGVGFVKPEWEQIKDLTIELKRVKGELADHVFQVEVGIFKVQDMDKREAVLMEALIESVKVIKAMEKFAGDTLPQVIADVLKQAKDEAKAALELE